MLRMVPDDAHRADKADRYDNQKRRSPEKTGGVESFQNRIVGMAPNIGTHPGAEKRTSEKSINCLLPYQQPHRPGIPRFDIRLDGQNAAHYIALELIGIQVNEKKHGHSARQRDHGTENAPTVQPGEEEDEAANQQRDEGPPRRPDQKRKQSQNNGSEPQRFPQPERPSPSAPPSARFAQQSESDHDQHRSHVGEG